MQAEQPGGERWSGRLGFILATIGSAVGLGSIWKFPCEVGENGGAVFLLLYLLGLPSMLSFNLWAEWPPLAALPGFAGSGVLGVADRIASNLLLPLTAGWRLA